MVGLAVGFLVFFGLCLLSLLPLPLPFTLKPAQLSPLFSLPVLLLRIASSSSPALAGVRARSHNNNNPTKSSPRFRVEGLYALQFARDAAPLLAQILAAALPDELASLRPLLIHPTDLRKPAGIDALNETIATTDSVSSSLDSADTLNPPLATDPLNSSLTQPLLAEHFAKMSLLLFTLGLVITTITAALSETRSKHATPSRAAADAEIVAFKFA